MGTGDGSDLAMKGKEKGLREEGKVDNDQIALEGRGPDHLDHHPLGSVLAKQELCVSADGGQVLQLCDVLEGDGGQEDTLETALLHYHYHYHYLPW